MNKAQQDTKQVCVLRLYIAYLQQYVKQKANEIRPEEGEGGGGIYQEENINNNHRLCKEETT